MLIRKSKNRLLNLFANGRVSVIQSALIRVNPGRQLLLLYFMDRPHASGRLRTSNIIGDHSTVSHIDGQTTTFGASLLYILNSGRIALEHGNFVNGRILNPIASAFSIWLRQNHVALRDCFFNLARLFKQVDIGYATGEPISSLPNIDIAFVVQSAIYIRVRHRIRGSKYWYRAAGPFKSTPRVVDFTLHVPVAVHFLLAQIDCQPVGTDKIVVLPGPRASAIDCNATVAVKLASIADDVNRTLHFGKGRGSVGLLLTVEGGRCLAAAVRDLVSQIRIKLNSLRPGARIPDRGVTATQTNCVIARGIGNVCGNTVAIILIKLGFALRIQPINILRVLNEDCSHLL